MKYFYKAKNQNGEIISGTKEASDKMSLMKDLKNENLEYVTASEVKENWFVRLNNNFTAVMSRVKSQDKIIFAKNLGSMIEAGLPMARALDVLQRQTKNKKFKKIINNLQEEIKSGKSLSEALALYPRIFQNLFVSMVKAGEESGSITGSLKIVGEQMEKSLTLQKKIRGAMMYPAIILIVMSVIAVLMMIYVVPTLVSTFTALNVSLPWSTKFIIGVSGLFINHGILLLGALILVVASFMYFMRTLLGRRILHALWIKTPIIGDLIKEINSARTARTLSSLLSSGVEVMNAIEITKQVVQNVYFKDVIEKAQKAVQNGEALSRIFLQNQKLFPSFVGEMVSVGEETGKLPSMLLEVAVYYENEVDQRTKDMSTVIEPVLMVMIGAAVGFFAISMLSPTYSVLSNIK